MSKITLTRTLALLFLIGTILALLVGEIKLSAQSQSFPTTGIAVPSLASFDRVMKDIITGSWGIPGGALAVVKDGRLVYARGFGLADKENNQPVQPESLFRIASISKPITAVSILKLMEDGKLSLNDKAFCRLGTQAGCILTLEPPSGASVDSRIYDITVRHLLWHTGGWDRDRSFDPMFMPTTKQAAEAVGTPPPASCETVIRYMLGRRLDFAPGTSYTYSNLGYCVLGRIIEKITGQTYEAYVQENVLRPLGVARMRIGRTLLDGRFEGEVRYYAYPQAPLTECVFPGIGQCAWPYGGFYLEAMDSHGGWIASAIDLLRFVTAVDGRRSVGTPLLNPETVQLMISRPDLTYWRGRSWYYAMGWAVRPVGSDANWWHDGSLPGTSTILVREAQTGQKLAWAALFNSRPRNWENFMGAIDRALWQAVNEVTEWPTHDLFEQYP